MKRGKKMRSEKARNMVQLILFIIIVILILIIGYKIIQLKDKERRNEKLIQEYKTEISNLKKELDMRKNNTNVDYYMSYSSLWLEPDQYTTLSLKGDGTFSMNINACEGIIPLEGKYTEKNNVLSLTDLSSDFSGFTGEGTTIITFDIQNDGTLKVNNDIACMFKDSILSKK